VRPLVIFDCDGVLIDSEVIFGRVLGECLIAADFPTTIEEAMALGIGKNRLTLTAAVESQFGRSLPEGFFEAMRARVDIAFERELRPIPGIEALLAALPAARCVASNSHLERVRHALSVTRLLRLFDPHVFSASQVAHGKPAPTSFSLPLSSSIHHPRSLSWSKTVLPVSRPQQRPACRSSAFAAAAIARATMPSGSLRRDACTSLRACLIWQPFFARTDANNSDHGHASEPR